MRVALYVALAAALVSCASADVLCVCRCCYLGDCAPLENASWPMSDCEPCSASRCREHVQSAAVRRKVARTFEVFREDEDADRPLPPGVQDETSAEERALINAHRVADFADEKFDVCEVVALTEAVSCERKNGKSCKVSTDITAECFDRHAPTVLYVTWFFLFAIVVGLVLGFTKDFLPSLHEFNRRNFDY